MDNPTTFKDTEFLMDVYSNITHTCYFAIVDLSKEKHIAMAHETTTVCRLN